MQKILKEQFPQSLLEIPEPPENLYIDGEIPDWDSTMLCVVGSRKCTNYGREACQKIISGLRGYDITIVSGLATGIDTIAHKTAMENGLKTISVPGSGLNRKNIYPSVNKRLAEEIVNSGNTLLSEYEPDFVATMWSFPKRNRIMAGLSKVILVIEAGKKSGTLITARLGLDYNKEVCVVPSSIFSDNSKGSNRLLRQGATVITSSEDLLETLGFGKEKKDDKQKALEFDNCSLKEKMVLELLNEPMSRDELIRVSKMPINEINPLISIMEIKGLIKESLGEIYKNV